MELKKKYGLFTAICMVVGIIIGSGVFFKAGSVLENTGGNLKLGIFAWIIGGLIMLISAYTFSILAKYTKRSGNLVDFMEEACGSKIAYYVGWYVSIMYFPILCAVLAWLCGKYTAILLGVPQAEANACDITIMCALIYLIMIYAINAIAPKLAGKFQISTTIIKLIPLFFIAIVGTIYGLVAEEQMLIYNFNNVVSEVKGDGLFKAICATAFAYDGWIVATSISKEVRGEHKTLGKALIIGAVIVLLTYILYYIGLSGVYPNEDFMNDSEGTVKLAFIKLLSTKGGYLLFVFVIISCLGTLNGLMMGCTRGMYVLASKNKGIKPDVMKEVDIHTNVAHNSALLGLLLTTIWFIFWIGNFKGWYGKLNFIDVSELSIIFLYSSYILIYVQMIRKYQQLNKIERFLVPSLAICASLFMVISCIYAHGVSVIVFIVMTVIVLGIGVLFEKNNCKKYAVK